MNVTDACQARHGGVAIKIGGGLIPVKKLTWTRRRSGRTATLFGFRECEGMRVPRQLKAAWRIALAARVGEAITRAMP